MADRGSFVIRARGSKPRRGKVVDLARGGRAESLARRCPAAVSHRGETERSRTQDADAHREGPAVFGRRVEARRPKRKTKVPAVRPGDQVEGGNENKGARYLSRPAGNTTSISSSVSMPRSFHEARGLCRPRARCFHSVPNRPGKSAAAQFRFCWRKHRATLASSRARAALCRNSSGTQCSERVWIEPARQAGRIVRLERQKQMRRIHDIA